MALIELGPNAGRARVFETGRLLRIVGVVGLVAAVAVPNLVRLARRSTQAEATSALKAAWTAEEAFRAVNRRYSESPAAVDLRLARGNRYTYAFAAVPDFAGAERRSAEPDSFTAGTTGLCADTVRWPAAEGPCVAGGALKAGLAPDGTLVVTASANLDEDPTRDEWSIASRPRVRGTPSSATTCASGSVDAGEPCHDVDDIF
ncbi:MAG: hypothetical protein RL199_691 [Pseudomonadota bacterium]|jgi:type II secretory pathway pseudopilin PulG